MNTTLNRCKCGKRISKHVTLCKACFAARSRELRAQGLAIVATGRCPDCGQGIRRNNAITGWYQCDGYGAEGFRKAGAKPCSWQVIIPREDGVLCNLDRT